MTALVDSGTGAAPSAANYGVWTDYRMPDDQSSWHPAVQRFYEYWRSVAPSGGLPGRQHIRPEDIVPLLPRVFILDVFRDPLRLRYRLAGTEVVRSVQCELTGRWVDEVQPETLTRPALLDRYRFIVETGQPTWRRGPTLWSRNPKHYLTENCLLPLAADGATVDKIFAVVLVFTKEGKEV
ncbi:MAG: PAS domain-containing protein [Stellaceae bacterium]